jgi:hypothetical protein
VATDTRPAARSPEAAAGRERTPGRREAGVETPQPALRTRLASPRSEPWRHDLREIRKTRFRPAGPDGRVPTPEGS